MEESVRRKYIFSIKYFIQLRDGLSTSEATSPDTVVQVSQKVRIYHSNVCRSSSRLSQYIRFEIYIIFSKIIAFFICVLCKLHLETINDLNNFQFKL